jgi:microsomal dipeptidase-like Zn-dependent dipeptidase
MTHRSLRTWLPILAILWAVRPALAAVPASPSNLVVRGTAPGTVTVSWDPSLGATEYRVYADVDPMQAFVTLIPLTIGLGSNAHLVATTSTAPAVESGLPPLVRRYYAVVAVNGDGESAPAFADWVVVPAQPDGPIFGWADLHTHQFSNLGFGRKLVWGNAFSPAGIFDALPFCDAVHGFQGLLDPIGNILRTGSPIATHNTAGGSPTSDVQFDGWPAFNTFTHQQMYYEWVRRAFEGGLRLMVVHAVNNTLLCEINGHDPQFTCEDMDTVDDQLQMAKDLEAYVDSQSGGPGLGWYRIAYSGTEARHIINSGRMAVVLGLEVDHLFGCGLNSGCTDQSVTTALDTYYAKGVRHLFPVHVFDNAFGGAAIYNPLFTWGNKLEENVYFTPRECSADGYSYKQPAPGPLEIVAQVLFGLSGPAPTTFAAECNARALQPLGATLIRAMMARKMILDIDHMSALTAGEALDIAEQAQYPGVVGGHTGVLSVASGQQANEIQKTPSQLARLRALGGMIGIGLGADRATSTHPDGVLMAPGSLVVNDCGWSSKVFAQSYLAGVAAFGGSSTAAIGIGSDFNGLTAAPGPRFGNNRCYNDPSASPQTGGVVYPFPIFAPAGVNAGHLGHAASPSRLGKPDIFSSAQPFPWDYNTDGVAHVGLMPDFIQDLRTVGVTDAQLQPLFRSAEAYVHMWELAEQVNVNPPTAAITQSPAPNAAGWNNSDVTVSMIGTPSAGGSSVSALTFSTAGAVVMGPTSVAGAVAQVIVSQEGATTVSVTAKDTFSNASSPASLTVRLDKTAPGISCPASDGMWHAADVFITCTASDAVSGLAAASDASFVLSTTVPNGTETAFASTGQHTVADMAGNAVTAGPIAGNRIDKKAPAISIGVPAGATYVVNQPVAASYGCADGGSGVASCAGPVANGAALDTTHPGATGFVVSATDNVGNTSTASAGYTVGYAVCLDYDPTKVKHAGSVVPIKIQVCDASGVNFTSPAIVVTATGLVRVGSTVTGVLEDAGNANPDNAFRLDGDKYIFNLSTKGLSGGTWALTFTVSGDPTAHSALFQIR